MDKTSVVFDNTIDKKTLRKAENKKSAYLRKFGDDSKIKYFLKATKNPTLGNVFHLQELSSGDYPMEFDEKAVIVGNIRMGYGHYRIAMAMASCAHALGFTPYWFDLSSFKESTGGKMISHQNKLYSLGSKLSQQSRIFNHFVWEPMNKEGFKKLTYHAIDQKNAELLRPLFGNMKEHIPYIGTHAWASQGAIHSGMKKVVNVIPDNWPLALHYSEGSHHTVQTASAYFGYKTLLKMAKKPLKAMKDGFLSHVGHYVDHELVSNLEEDTSNRIKRIKNKKTLRIVIPVGGAGAGMKQINEFIRLLIPELTNKKVQIFLNFGEHKKLFDAWKKKETTLMKMSRVHERGYASFLEMVEDIELYKESIQVIYHEDIYEAVYSTNVLMRKMDLLVTKPSELAYYPIPKLFIKRVGGHEAYNAIHSFELGDGTMECQTKKELQEVIGHLIHSTGVLRSMNENILKNHKMKVYHGAYEVVKLATQESNKKGK